MLGLRRTLGEAPSFSIFSTVHVLCEGEQGRLPYAFNICKGPSLGLLKDCFVAALHAQAGHGHAVQAHDKARITIDYATVQHQEATKRTGTPYRVVFGLRSSRHRPGELCAAVVRSRPHAQWVEGMHASSPTLALRHAPHLQLLTTDSTFIHLVVT